MKKMTNKTLNKGDKKILKDLKIAIKEVNLMKKGKLAGIDAWELLKSL